MAAYDNAVRALIKRHREELTEEIRGLYKTHGKDVVVDVLYDVNVYPVHEVPAEEAKKAFDRALGRKAGKGRSD